LQPLRSGLNQNNRSLATIIVDAKGPVERGAMVSTMLSSGQFDPT
jgi:hypothetical protein